MTLGIKAALAITLGIIFYSITEAYVVEVGESPVEALVDQNVTLQCSYTVEPGDSADLPQIDWYNGNTTENGDNNRILSLINASNLLYPNEDTFSPTKFTATRVEIESNKTAVDLHISGVQTNDSSIYLCDINFDVEGTIVLDVQVPSPPTFVGIRGYQHVLEGGSNNLTCWSDGVPTTTCTWKHQDKDLPTPTPDPCLLDLPNMQRSDAGTYKCTVANSEGSTIGSVKIDVEFSPLITNRDNPDEFVDAGGWVVLRCEAEGNPLPGFTWTKDSTVIDGSEGYIDLNEGIIDNFNRFSTLAIQSVDPDRDYGDYTCDATNPHGHDILTINLSETTVPEPPTGVSVTDATDTELTVTWTEGEDGGHLQTFSVQYRESGSGADWKKVDYINKPPRTLTSLQPLTQYEIRVGSQNKLGESDYSATITASTTAPSTEIPVSNGSGKSSASKTPVIIGVFVAIVLLIFENSKHEPLYAI